MWVGQIGKGSLTQAASAPLLHLSYSTPPWRLKLPVTGAVGELPDNRTLTTEDGLQSQRALMTFFFKKSVLVRFVFFCQIAGDSDFCLRSVTHPVESALLRARWVCPGPPGAGRECEGGSSPRPGQAASRAAGVQGGPCIAAACVWGGACCARGWAGARPKHFPCGG